MNEKYINDNTLYSKLCKGINCVRLSTQMCKIYGTKRRNLMGENYQGSMNIEQFARSKEETEIQEEI